MRIPLYTSSVITACGNPSGITGYILKTSLQIALMYGKESLSSKSGNLPRPMTLSSSSWALCWTSGFVSIRKMKFRSVLDVFFVVGDYVTVRDEERVRTVSFPAVYAVPATNCIKYFNLLVSSSFTLWLIFDNQDAVNEGLAVPSSYRCDFEQIR